jgi:serine protease
MEEKMFSQKLMLKQRWLYNLLALLICASLLLGTTAASPAAAFQQGKSQAQAEGDPPEAEWLNYRLIVVKFREDSPVRMSEGRLASPDGADLSAAESLLEGLSVRPLFSRTAEELEQETANLRSAEGEALPDLSQYYLITLSEETTFEQASALLEALQGLENVETAYMEPIYKLATDKDPATPDMSTAQGYREDAASGGIDADYAATILGGRGYNVRVTDIELGWQIGHEDLNIKHSSLLGRSENTSQPNDIAHGTNVLGVIAGFNNGYGVTGIASDAEIKLVSNGYVVIGGTEYNYTTPDAIDLAAANSRAGDVIVIPLQVKGPDTDLTCTCGADCTDFEFIPVEWKQANFDAIKRATAKGIIVVEAAGNGSMNLGDTDIYGNVFIRSSRNSGALIVGAGDSATRARRCSSNYGDRIDLQGWGDSIVTTGGLSDGSQDTAFETASGFDSGGDAEQFYTDTFGGTSGATAMVAGAVASLQGIARKQGIALTPAQTREMLINTGSAQTGSTSEHIGPLPDLKNAIDTYLMAGDYTPLNGLTTDSLRPTLNWPNAVGATKYWVQISTGTTFTDLVYDATVTRSEFTPSKNLAKNTIYYWKARPYSNGSWAKWSNTYQFTTPNPTDNPPVTTLTYPKEGFLFTSWSPTFYWKDLSSLSTPPDGYHIQISTTNDFAAATTIEAYPTDANYPVAAPLDGSTQYYWRVRTYIGAAPDQIFSAWTPWRSFKTAIASTSLVSPADGADVDTLRPTFQWNAVANARGYELQISTSAKFKSGVQKYTLGDTTTSYQIKKDLSKKASNVYWRVRVIGSFGNSGWSPVWTVHPPIPPNVPANLKPKTKTVNKDFSPVFTWGVPKGGAVGYQFEISKDSDFDPADLSTDTQDVTDPTYTAAGLDPNSAYYWHVRAVNASGEYSNWSKKFVIYTGPLLSVTLDSPSSGDTVDSRRPTLQWTDATPTLTGAYWLQISRNASFTRIFYSKIVKNASPHTILKSLPLKGTFYWRAANKGKYGYSAWTAGVDFMSPDEAPYAPSLVSPATGAVLINYTPKLVWNAPGRKPIPDGYQVQVSKTSKFDSSVVDEPVTTKTYTIPYGALDESGKYYWRVGSDLGGVFTWSSVRVFYTPGTVKGVVSDIDGGAPIAGARVYIGDGTQSTVTNAAGEFTFNSLVPGDYTFKVDHSGYIIQKHTLTVGKGANVEGFDFPLVAEQAEKIRIVLTWAKEPADLDAHLWLPTTNQTHIHKDNTGDLASTPPDAELEIMDEDGYGPEVITINRSATNPLYPGNYLFAVKLNGYPDMFPLSDARVLVYEGNTFKKEYHIPLTGSGRWWKVFSINVSGSSYSIKDHNQLISSSPAPYADTP